MPEYNLLNNTNRELVKNRGLIPVQLDLSRDYDADTIYVKNAPTDFYEKFGGRTSIRFSGIDAPETSHRRGQLNQSFGKESKDILTGILNESSANRAYLRTSGSVNKNRVLGEVFIENKEGNLISVNQEIIKRGAAYVSHRYPDKKVVTPEIKKQYDAVIKAALKSPQKEGLFTSNAVLPEDFRDNKLDNPINALMYNIGLKRNITPVLQQEKKRLQMEAAVGTSRKLGVTNQQLAPYFGDVGEGFILPAQYGASYFYEKAVYAANREKAGLSVSPIEETEGYATASYKLKYLATHGTNADSVPWYIKNFDREMATPGLSYYVNKYAAIHGLGRVYKEEVGPLASLAGAFGAVLDRSLIQYGMHAPDYIRRQQEISNSSSTGEPPKGFFEGTLSFAASFGVNTTQAVLTYFLLGVPFGIATSELFKVSSQGLLDIALEQIDAPLTKNFLSQSAAKLAVFGPDLSGKSTADLKKILLDSADKSTGHIESPFKAGIKSVIQATNLFQNQRAGIFFDTTIRPFIEDVINPYNPRANSSTYAKWKHLQEAMTDFRTVLTSPIYAVFEGDAQTGKFILKNDGYEKSKEIAKALDYLGGFLPANPLKWGWMGKNYDSNVNFTMSNNKVTERNFIALSQVFSFTDLLTNLERVYYGGEYLRIVNQSTVVDNTSISGRISSKAISAIAIPFQIMKRGAQTLKAGISYMLGKDNMLGDILNEHRKLRKIEGELIGKALVWNEAKQMRELTGSAEDIEKFIKGALGYHSKLNPEKELEIMQKASDFFADQDYAVTKVRNPYTEINSNGFLRNKGKFGLYAVALVGINLALEDLFTATTGASIFSQVAVALGHKEVGATAEFTPTRIFGWGGGWQATAASLAWTGFSVAAGLGVAAVTQGYNREMYHLSEASLDIVRNFAAKNTIGNQTGQALFDHVVTVLGSKNKGGLVRPGGGFFKAFVITTTGLLAARTLSRFATAGLLNMVRSIPFVGETLFGEGKIKPNENLALVEKMVNVRNVIIERMQSGKKISRLEAGAAYQLGILQSITPIVDNELKSKDVRVVAQQSPLPYFQFFLAQTNKGRYYDDQGQVLSKGILSFKVGLQTAPILGTNLSFGSPVSLNLNSKNKFGVSLVYNNEDDNITNYLQAIGSMGFAVASFAASTIATLDSVGAVAGFFNKDNSVVNDLKETTNMVKTTFKTFYDGLEILVALPNYPLNFIKGIAQDRKEIFKAILEGFGLRGNNASKNLSITNRLIKFGIGAWIGHTAFKFVTDIFTDDQSKIDSAGLAGILVGGLAYAFKDKAPLIIKPITSRIKFNFNINQKLPTLPKNKAAWFVGALAFSAAWLMTDSEFGVTHGMDKKFDDNGEVTTDWIKKLSTVGIYTAVVTAPVLAISDIGKTPAQFLEDYKTYGDKLASISNYSDPLRYLQSQYYSFKRWSSRKYVGDYLKDTVAYLYEASVEGVTAKELATSLKAKDAFATSVIELKAVKFNAIEDLADSAAHSSTISQLWQRQEFLKFSSGTGRARKLTYAATALAAVGFVANTLMNVIGGTDSRKSNQQVVNSFYNKVDENAEFLGNVFRLLTWKEKKGDGTPFDKNIIVDQDGKTIQKLGHRLITPNDPQQQQVTNILKNIFAPFVVDSQNPYQSVLPGIGVTIRGGEFGTRYSPYAQQQSALQDTSFAVYSQLPAYLFKLAAQGNRKHKFLVEEGMKKALKGQFLTNASDEAMVQAAALATSTASAQLSPLGKPRKFSTPISDSSIALVSGDRLLTMSLKLRMRRSSELAYQPLESIVNRMHDPNDLSILSNFAGVVDSKNPLAAANGLKQTKDIDEKLLSNSNLNDLLRGIFGLSNRIELSTKDITVDKKFKEIVVSVNQVEDSTELLQNTSLHLDSQGIKKSNPFELTGRILSLGDQIVTNVVGSSVKFGIYAGAALITGTIGLGLAASFMFNSQQTRFAETRQLTKNLFGASALDDAGSFKAFYANTRVSGVNGTHDFNSFQIDSKGRKFTVSIPDGVNLNTKDINNVLQSVMIQIHDATVELDKNLFGVSDKFNTWNGKPRADIISDLSTMYTMYVDNYIDKVLDSYVSKTPGSSYSLGDLTSSKLSTPEQLVEMKASIKKKLLPKIEEALLKEIAGGDTLGENLLSRFKGFQGKEAANQLSYLILEEISPFLRQLQKNLYFLETEDGLGYAARVSEEIYEHVSTLGGQIKGGGNFFKRSSTTPRLKLPDLPGTTRQASSELLQSLDSISPNVYAGLKKRAVLKQTGELLGNAVGTVFTVMDTVDIFSSYNRLAAYQSDENRTEGETNYASQHVGATTINSAFSILMSNLIFKQIGPKLYKQAFKTRGRGALVVGAFLLAGATFIAARDFIGEQWNKFTNIDWVQNISNTGSNSLSWVYNSLSLGLGKGIVELDKLASKIPGVKRGVLTQLIGGAVTGATLAFGFGKGGAAIRLAAGIGATTGAITQALFPGISRYNDGVLGRFTSWLSSIPVLNTLVTDYRLPLSLYKSNQYHGPDSPIYSATASDAIAQDSQRSLAEAGDVSGNRTKAMFSNPTIDGLGYSKDAIGESQAMLGKPTRSLMDPLLEKEIQVRSQYYNQSIVGRSVWSKLIYTAENYTQLKQMTYLQSLGDPVSKLNHTKVQAQEEKDIKQLQAATKNKTINANVTALMASIFKNSKSKTDKPDSKLKTDIIFSKDNIAKSSKLKDKVNQTNTSEYAAVLVYNIKADKTENTIQINHNISTKNDIALKVTEGLVNPYFATPGYTS